MDADSSVLSVSEQCRILGLPRSSYYKKRSEVDEEKDRRGKDEEFSGRCDAVLAEWTENPTYGYQKMARHLQRKDNAWATEHCVRQIYAMLGIKGVTPTFKTTRTAKGGYRKYPYLLRGRKIRYANEVWATDITYIKLLGRTVYFTAIIDLRSRKILSWRLSESMDVSFCLDALVEAIAKYGVPAIFNTDCGSQYTSDAFTGVLEENGIQISMDGIGRCKDNIIVERTWRTLKYEWVFLREYGSIEELEGSLGEFVEFFNSRRIHQGLDYMTPDEVYRQGTFPDAEEETKVA